MGSNEHQYHDTTHPEDQDSDFRVESADPGVDTDSEEHFLDNSQDETAIFTPTLSVYWIKSLKNTERC